MGFLDRVRNLLRTDLTGLFGDASVGIWKPFLYLSFFLFVLLLFAGHMLPDWSFPLRGYGQTRPMPDQRSPDRPPDQIGPVHKI